MNQSTALTLIAAGLLLAGWLDGQDAEVRASRKQAVQVVCTHCAGGVR